MAVGPEFHDFLEPDGPGGLCPVEAVEGGEEDFDVVHHSRHVVRAHKGTQLIKHLRSGAIYKQVLSLLILTPIQTASNLVGCQTPLK